MTPGERGADRRSSQDGGARQAPETDTAAAVAPQATSDAAPQPPAAEDGAPPAEAPPAPSVGDPRRLHKAAIVIDTHNDVTLRMIREPDFDFGVRNEKGHTDLVRMREGGLDAQFLSVWVRPRDFEGEKAWHRSLEMFDAIDRVIERHPAQIKPARTAAEVRAIVAEGKVAFLIGVEGAHALGRLESPEQGLDRLRQWYDRGARYVTLTWMNSNALGGSSGDRGRTKGLTELGRRAVRQMNDMGMMVDVSHVSDPTFFEAIEESRLPVIASHSGVRALHDHFRNLSDEQLRALAKNGGAVCIVYYPGFLDAEWNKARRESRRNGRPMKCDPVPLARVVDHIDHAVKVAGVDHVCLGSDFDGISEGPAGLEDVSKLPGVTEELARRGYSAEAIEKILGGNVLRVMEANERGARPAP